MLCNRGAVLMQDFTEMRKVKKELAPIKKI